MTPGRAAAYIGGAMLLAAWLSSAATSQPDAEPVPASTPQGTSGTDPVGFDVQAQAARLRARLASAPAPQQPSRNPFAFVERERPDARQARAAAVPQQLSITESAPVDPEPALSLVGMAEQQGPKGPTRTAVIAGAGEDVFLVTEGQEVAGRYRVTTIAADAVELQDLSTGAIRRLILR